MNRDAVFAQVGPPRWEIVVGSLIIIAATAPGMLLLGVSDVPGAPENPIFRFYWLPIYAAAAAMSLFRWRQMLDAWPAMLLTGLLIAWAYASQIWSILPDVTGRRAFALLMTTLIGLYLGAVFPGRLLVKMLAASFAILALGSLLITIAIPRFGLESEPTLRGDWRGLWITKNTLAEFMMMGVLATVSALAVSPWARWRWLAMGAACLLLLLLSRGKSSLLCLVLGVGVVSGLWIMRRGPIAAIVTAFIGGTVAIWGGFLAVTTPTIFLTALGKDPTLTGRTDIWAAVLRQSAASPALGFGFGAFWEKTSVPAQVIRKQTHWLVPTAHNGWLDLLVQVGWIGVALFAIVLTVTLIALLTRTYSLGDGYFCLAFMMVFLTLSLSESVLEQHNNLPWSLFVAIMALAFRPSRLSELPQRDASLHLRRAAIETGA
jgi:O-antigen ligase